MGVLDLGVGPALMRYIAVAEGKKDRKGLQETISSAQLFYLLVGLFSVMVLLMISQFPHAILGKESASVGNLGKVLILFTVNIGLYFPLISLTAVLMGLQYHFMINITRISIGIIRAVIVYYLLSMYAGKGLLILAMMEPIFNVIQFAIFAYVLHADETIPSFSLAACSTAKMKELFTYGAKSAVLMIASRIQNASLPFIISNIVGVSKIVFFAMPNRLVGYAKDFSMAIGEPLTPYFASKLGRGDEDQTRESWLQTTLALQIITLAMPFFLFFCGERFLSIWIGREYGVGGRGVLYCLLTGLIIEAFAPNVSRILMATGNHGRAAITWFILSCACIPLATFGASLWGINGVALGSSIIIVMGNFITLRLACKEVKVPLRIYGQRTILRLVVPLILLIGVLWVTSQLLTSLKYSSLIAQILISGTVYLMAIWRLTLSADIRVQILGRLRGSLINLKFRLPGY
jgi:O-antigen/teichoic acid export membrane protein